MQRIACDERPDWRSKADAAGFRFHTIAGERYWDERAYYAFTLKEIEADIEAPTAELDAMCRELVARAVDDERMLKVLRIPERFWTFIAASWKRGDPSLYGRFDLSYDGQGPGEAARIQRRHADLGVRDRRCSSGCGWRTRRRAQITPKDADQYNSLHERLIEGWKEIGQRPATCISPARSTIRRTAAPSPTWKTPRGRPASPRRVLRDGAASAARRRARFVDLHDKPIELMFKLYPWEWMFREQFGAYLAGSPTRWLEPPWKAILSNKGILPLLWAMFPRHPNLLPAYFEDDPKAAELGNSFVRKPLYSREGANVDDRGRGPGGRSGRGPVWRGRLCPPGGRDAAALCRTTTPPSAPGSRPASPAGSRCARM